MKNSWLDDYMGLACPDRPTLAEFVGDPRIHFSYEIDLESIDINSGSTNPSPDDGHPRHS